MRIEEDIKLDYSDVLMCPKRSTLESRSEVSLETEFTFRYSKKKWTGVPIIAANMDTTGTFEVAKAIQGDQLLTCMHKHYTIDQWVEHANEGSIDFSNVIPSCGIRDEDIAKLQELMEKIGDKVNFICLDVANGYSERFSRVVTRCRELFPDVVLMAGNVVTREMTEELILSGADVVKVGIGPGSVCTTRRVTGVGYPQLSAVIECADAAHGLDGHIIADGGCVVPGDVAKAFAAGADFVMLGGMFAGHDETGHLFYGMSSDTAMNKYSGGVAKYRASEGKTVEIPERGPISGTVQEILGGVRSACTYIGARKLRYMQKCVTFVRVSRQLNTAFDGSS